MRYTRNGNILTPIQEHKLTAFEKLVIWMAVVVLVTMILIMFHTEPSQWTSIMLKTWMI